jgi:acetate kinase
MIQAPEPDLSQPDCPAAVLAINGGSSSLKFALYAPHRTLSGKIERIGLANPTLSWSRSGGKGINKAPVAAASHSGALELLEGLIQNEGAAPELLGVGHRIVHGGPNNTTPRRITPELLDELERLRPFNPEHLPAQLQLIQGVSSRFPETPQVACFDTTFHAAMPMVAQTLAIPHRYHAEGVRRYGFHGLSYEFIMEELIRLDGENAARRRLILAHLGNGASLAAVRDGRSIDTSMGFTPTAGIPMSTRSGDLDPGLFLYLHQREGMSPQAFHTMVNRESGLLGVSGTSSDLRDLLASEATDPRAAQAVELFCYQIKKWIGAFTAILGGLDSLVFTGGIGENCIIVRDRVCRGLSHLGIELDPALNEGNSAIISKPGTPVRIRVIRTDEEQMIARAVRRILKTLPC